MDIEAIVIKHIDAWRESTFVCPEAHIRAALTELAAGYEERVDRIVASYLDGLTKWQNGMVALVHERDYRIRQLSETHAIELRAYEATVESQAERIRQLEAERVPAQQYTTGHCANKAQPGGCQLHNLHCNYPICDRRPAAPQYAPSENTNEK